MNALDNLNFRSSIPAKFLIEPAPNAKQLKQILQCAMSVPDHGGLQPFRFLTIQHEAREKLAHVFEQAIRQRNPDAGEACFKKQYQKPLRSPLIIVVVCCLRDNTKVPVIEQQLSAGCAAQNIMLATYALGFGACWLTGDNAYDDLVKEALGLGFNEQITGFIYVGTVHEHTGMKKRRSVDSICDEWVDVCHLETAI